MTGNYIAMIRGCIEDGMSNEEIAEAVASAAADAAENEALYGTPDDEYSHGRSRWQCDETYTRNDAGEYIAFM